MITALVFGGYLIIYPQQDAFQLYKDHGPVIGGFECQNGKIIYRLISSR
ncbi:MAG: hypothetical protein IH585_04070 [Anaerolineaceae bacterium]|nr:hypothetical protein [Anaerolineaceae bacterium]